MVLNPLVSLFGRLVACSGRKRDNRQTDGQTDRPSTVTLAAHARRGLTSAAQHCLAISKFPRRPPSLPYTSVEKLFRVNWVQTIIKTLRVQEINARRVRPRAGHLARDVGMRARPQSALNFMHMYFYRTLRKGATKSFFWKFINYRS